jgi:hypothetical protein
MLTVDDFREHVTSTLGDGALEMLLSAAYEVIDERIGSDADVTELMYGGPGPILMLSRKALAIVSVTENERLLGATDYELRGRVLLRLHTGAIPGRSWHGRVDVVYTPLISQDQRDRVAIALVKQDLNHDPGATTERIGDWSETASQSYIQERADILASLSSQPFVLL